MSSEWPDLAQFRERTMLEDCFETANLGCSLCRMVLAILRDAREKQCITEPKGSWCSMEALRRDDRFFMILNDSELGWESKELVAIYREGKQLPPPRLGC